MVAPGGGECGLVVHLGAHAPGKIDLPGERQVLHVAGLGVAFVGHRAGARHGGAAQQQRVAAAAEGRDQHQRAGHRRAQGDVQHGQRLRATEVAHAVVFGRDQRRGRDAELFRDRIVDACERRGHGELADVAGRHPAILQALAQRGDRDLHVALVAHPAFFPAVFVVLAGLAEVVDQVGVRAGAGDQRRDGGTVADQRTGRAVAEDHFLRAGWACDAALRRQQHLRSGVRRTTQRGRQLGERSAWARGGVAQHRVGRDAERGGHDAGVQAFGEGQCGGGKCQLRDSRIGRRGAKLAGGLDGHRHAVFVPVGHGATALGERLQARCHPAVLSQYVAALQAQPRHVARGCQQAEFVAFFCHGYSLRRAGLLYIIMWHMVR